VSKFTWRKHQQQVYNKAFQLKESQAKKADVFTEVVPGGGKSKNVSILAHQLRQGRQIGGIVWITPRRSLQAQAVDSAREGPGGDRPTPGFDIGDSYRNPKAEGFATNFASLLVNPKEHLEALRKIKGNILLVADEVHTCRGGHDLKGWGRAFAALRKEVFDRDGFQLWMTGTARRWDNSPVITAPYDPSCQFHLDPNEVIAYDRDDGLGDNAITKIQPQYFDGTVQWTSSKGLGFPSPKLISEFGRGLDPTLCGRALSAFLSADNLKDVHLNVVWDALTRPKQGWLRYRTIYGNNQMIIMVDRQETAFKLANALNSPEFRSRLRAKSKQLGVPFNDDFRALLAVSGDPMSGSAINSYRFGRLEKDMLRREVGEGTRISAVGRAGQPVHCLVTVSMAAIGLDAPACTHLVNLGIIRSIPWLTQAFARAWRAGQYKWPANRKPLPVCDRRAYIWMPADIRMQLAFDAICSGSYASGLSDKQVPEAWHTIPDPADDSPGLDELEPEEPEEKSESTQQREKYLPVPGSCRITNIRVASPA